MGIGNDIGSDLGTGTGLMTLHSSAPAFTLSPCDATLSSMTESVLEPLQFLILILSFSYGAVSGVVDVMFWSLLLSWL